jgi:hypothetical protein
MRNVAHFCYELFLHIANLSALIFQAGFLSHRGSEARSQITQA